MRKIGIVGAGQSGLQLGIALRQRGYEVVIASNLTATQIRDGGITSSQCMFDTALAQERALGINFWDASCPPVDGIAFTLAGADGGKAIDWAARLDRPAQSVDQRLKMPRWMAEFERLGGELRICDVGIPELEALTHECDLVLVASGKGAIGKLFERDASRSAFDKPMRALGLTYVTGLAARPDYSAVCFNVIPGVGEYFVFPAETLSGPCEIMVFEGIPGGPMDCWNTVTTPDQHLAVSLDILKRFVPWEYERCADVTLTDDKGILAGRFPPTIRKPLLRLPSGRLALGMGDAVCLNDPITGQGSNNASRCATAYLAAILEQGDRPFDGTWMQAAFERYWDYARHVVAWTNAMLLPPEPHAVELLVAAQRQPRLARWFANNFSDPRNFFPAFGDPAAAGALIAQAA